MQTMIKIKMPHRDLVIDLASAKYVYEGNDAWVHFRAEKVNISKYIGKTTIRPRLDLFSDKVKSWVVVEQLVSKEERLKVFNQATVGQMKRAWVRWRGELERGHYGVNAELGRPLELIDYVREMIQEDILITA